MKKSKVSNGIVLRADSGIQFRTVHSDDVVEINVELIKTQRKERAITLDDKQLNRILRKAEKIYLKGDPNVKLNLEWISNIRRLVKQARL